MPDTAHLVDPATAEAIEVLGPTIRFLTPPDGPDDGPCVMHGTIPPGVVVPLHSHPDPETFLMHSGAVEGLVDGDRWVPVGPGDIFHAPGGARHAWRNRAGEPAVMTVIATNRLGRFFREIAAPVDDPIAHFLTTAERYGYWNATPEENAAVGLGA